MIWMKGFFSHTEQLYELTSMWDILYVSLGVRKFAFGIILEIRIFYIKKISQRTEKGNLFIKQIHNIIHWSYC